MHVTAASVFFFFKFTIYIRIVPTEYDTIRYDTIEEFNVDSKAECDQLNLAHVA